MNTEPPPSKAARMRPNLPVWSFPLVAIAGIGVLAGLWFALDAAVEVVSFKTIGLNYELLKEHVSGNKVQSAILYVGAYALLGALILPGSMLFVVLSGLLFGAGIGIPLSLFASMLAATLAFWIAQTALGRRLSHVSHPTFDRIRAGFGRHALGYMLFLRLTPGLPFAALNVVPSLIGVPFATFALGTFIGLVPSRIALSTAGAGLGVAIETQNNLYWQCLAEQTAGQGDCAYDLDITSLLTKEMLIASVALAILALVPAIVNAVLRVRRQRRLTSKS